MKNKFYASLFIGIGLTIVATPSFAKATQPTAKKQQSSSTKSTKTNAHNVVSSKKSEQPAAKKTASSASKQHSNSTKSHQIAETKDSKHGKSKAQQLADAKDSKHGKSKAQQLADAKDSKHGKSKAQQLADAKDSKHGKSKAQQLADAKDSKHGKSKTQQLADAKNSKHDKSKKSHPVEEELYGDESDGDASTVVDGDEQLQATNETEQTGQENLPDNALQAIDNHFSANKVEDANPLIIAPTKSNNLFTQQTDNATHTPPPAAIFAKSNDIPTPQAINNRNEEDDRNPLIAAPKKLNNPAPANRQLVNIAINERVHSLITNGSKSVIESDDEADADDDEESPKENTTLHIQPANNKRIRSSISSNGNNFIDNSANSETTQQVASAHGVIDSSLNSAGEKAGLSSDMVIELADIFAWDIDFANNLQEGDQFTVIYEEGAGNAHNRIIAAQFINRGKTYTAIRYKDKEGIVSYYTPEGRSLRKAFLSTPIDYAKVSSHFDPHRRHPILNRIRAHKGVDYAARTGTPVKAAGDGVVTFHGNKGGYGRMIVLSHGEHYETAYAHLSNFRKNLQDGEPVKQGDVIGYVGSSGLATGPHLHYEFRVDGQHRDPEKLDSQQAMRLPNGIWEDFHAQTIPVLTRLNQAKANTLVAKNL